MGVNGILVVDKKEGPTSRRVVDLARRALGEKKAGHLGTLDPFATGILPICLGKATRLARFLTGGGKTYEGVIRLGATSDTLDRTGTILRERAIPPGLDMESLDPFLEKLRGEIDQVPPMYSAVQVDGQRLYRLARQGIEIERKPVKVHVETEILDYTYPELKIKVACSKGTYIRSIASEIGEKLGCSGHLITLTRTQSGSFLLKDCIDAKSLSDPSFSYIPHLRKTV